MQLVICLRYSTGIVYRFQDKTLFDGLGMVVASEMEKRFILGINKPFCKAVISSS